MTEKLALERRLMRSMVPPLYVDAVDELLSKLTSDPRTTGSNSIKMLGSILSSNLGQAFRTECVNLFFAGIVFTRALESSPEYQLELLKWLDEDESSGRQRLINFKEAKAKIKGYL